MSPELLFLTKLAAAEKGRERGERRRRRERERERERRGGKGKEKEERRNASLHIFSAPIPRRTYFSHSLCTLPRCSISFSQEQ